MAARSFGATRAQIYLRIYLPAMEPLIIEGLRMGLIFTVTGVLLAEMYGSPRGIGRVIFAWGETDIFRLLDNINPHSLEIVRDYFWASTSNAGSGPKLCPSPTRRPTRSS